MWDGIYIDGSTSGEVVIDGSSIEDAEVAIYSTDGGKFTILNSIFNKNFRNILMKTANGTHPGLVSNTSFSCSSSATSVSFPGAYLRAPHTTERTYSGIEAYTVDLFSISDNSFDNMNFGIIGDNSSLTIYSNSFSNIKQLYGSQKPKVLPLPAQWGVAIWASGNTGSPVRALTVGGSISQQNTIMNGTHGVIAEKNINTYVIGNKFQNLGGGSPSLNNSYAVLVRNQRARTIQVNSNEILRFRYGVRILQIVNSNAEIKYNTFNNLGGTVNTGLTSISAENAGVKSFTANTTSISNNTIKNCNVGVYASYYPGIHIYPNNDVSFPHASGTVSKIGIHVVGCNGAIIDGNMITKANPTVSASYKNNWLGISVENSLKATVGLNTVTNMGTGIRVYENCDVAQLVCNTFDRCYRGFWFTGAGGGTATIGNQLGSVPNEYPTANQWVNMGSSNFRLEGGIFPTVNWFYSAGATYNPFPQFLLANSIIGPVLSSNQSLCTSLPMIPQNPGSDPREDFLPTAAGTLDFDNFEEENKKLNKKFLYSKLKAEPNLLSLGNPIDQVFQNFYATETNSTSGKYEEIANEMAIGSHSNSAFANTLVPTSNAHEENLRTVNEVYLKSWGSERYVLDSAETNTLSNIAEQDPLIAGHEAVYSSRTMLNRHIVDYGTSNQRMAYIDPLTEEINPASNSKFEVYPNPSSGIFQFVSSEEFIGAIKIYDLKGQLIKETFLQDQTTLDLTHYDNGVYFYQITDGSRSIYGKLIISK